MVWILDHLEDIRADLRVFFRVDDYLELDGPTFFAWAIRCGAYNGVMAARWAKLMQDEQGTSRHTPPGGSSSAKTEMPLSALRLDPSTADLVEFL